MTIRLVPVYRYEQTAEQGEFLTAVRNWLHTLKLFIFALLCVAFVFLCGAGWERNNHNNQGCEIAKTAIEKPAKHKRRH